MIAESIFLEGCPIDFAIVEEYPLAASMAFRLVNAIKYQSDGGDIRDSVEDVLSGIERWIEHDPSGNGSLSCKIAFMIPGQHEDNVSGRDLAKMSDPIFFSSDRAFRAFVQEMVSFHDLDWDQVYIEDFAYGPLGAL
jgi:hypothetical protein